MQVPVVMTTSLGQKISTVAVPSANSSIFATATAPSSVTTPTGISAPAPKVLIQTVPAAENGEKITVQLAKIITIPAAQLAHCQLQPEGGAAPAVGMLGAPLALRTLSPTTQVVRLAVPAQLNPTPKPQNAAQSPTHRPQNPANQNPGSAKTAALLQRAANPCPTQSPSPLPAKSPAHTQQSAANQSLGITPVSSAHRLQSTASTQSPAHTLQNVAKQYPGQPRSPAPSSVLVQVSSAGVWNADAAHPAGHAPQNQPEPTPPPPDTNPQPSHTHS